MPDRFLDFRSDTLTQPTAGMRDAMANAEVGDDVFGEDPTVNRLQERVAELLGKEAALFGPSGTMTNQLGVKVHTQPGDELICEAGCHIYNYEQAGYVQLSGVAARPLIGKNGVLDLSQLEGQVRPLDDHLAHTRLLCLENTHNRGGGAILPYDNVESLCRWAHSEGLATHLDGARLFNAVVATGISAADWSRHFDTVSICFSKGLGAPIGSALAGPADLIKRARRHRKLFGGGMRQAGIVAAAALYALDHHVDRLADDHAHAQRLADAIRHIEGIDLDSPRVDTNIVIFSVDPRLGTAAEFAAHLRSRGLLMLAIGKQQVRAVTHLDLTAADVERAGEILLKCAAAAGQGKNLDCDAVQSDAQKRTAYA